MKNPIPDASTARRWNLLSDASSSAVIKSLARVSVTASPVAYAACLATGRVPSAAPEIIPRKHRSADLKVNGRRT